MPKVNIWDHHDMNFKTLKGKVSSRESHISWHPQRTKTSLCVTVTFLINTQTITSKKSMNMAIKTWLSNYIHAKQWDVITHPCPNFNVEVTARVWCNYIPHKTMGVIIYPFTNLIYTMLVKVPPKNCSTFMVYRYMGLGQCCDSFGLDKGLVPNRHQAII